MKTVVRPKTCHRKDGPRLFTGKRTKVRSGSLLMERTERLSKADANLLCAAMRRSPSIADAERVRDHHAEAPLNYTVRFLRKVVDATVEMQRLDDLRSERALQQFHEMNFPPIEERPGWYWTVHFVPGEEEAHVYQTHVQQGCTCPDWQYRHGLQIQECKHQKAQRAWLGLPALEEEQSVQRRQLALAAGTARPTDAEGRAAWCKANLALDF